MDLTSVSTNHLSEMERLAKELMLALRKAKLQDDPLMDSLRQLEIQAGEIRRTRFDAANPEYHAY